MFLCSVASELSTVVILFGDVIRDNPWVVQSEIEGCKV